VCREPGPGIVRMKKVGPDFEDPMLKHVSFNDLKLLQDLHAPATLIVEIRSSDPTIPNSLQSVGWTAFEIFDPSGELNTGNWRLPVYKCPT